MFAYRMLVEKSEPLREGWGWASARCALWGAEKAPPLPYFHHESPLGVEVLENTTSCDQSFVEYVNDRFTGLVYDPLTDEFVLENTVPTKPDYFGYCLRIVFGAVVTISLARSAFSVYRIGARASIRRLITNELGFAPNKSTHYRILRDNFLNNPLFHVTPNDNHSHGFSAALRTTAFRFTDALATASGLSTFCYQMSSRDQTSGKRGERTYYWAKDVCALPQYDEVEPTDLVSLVDVDYYVDMPTRLAETPLPHVLYTLIPSSAGRTTSEYSYSFNSKSEIEYKVRGGASYCHPLWNWCVDWFTVTKFTWFGLPYKTVTYDVSMRRIGEDKAIVLLAPMRVHNGLGAIFAWLMGRPLERLVTAIPGGFTKVSIFGEVKEVSVARQGVETSCTVEADVFNTLKSTKYVSPSQKLTLYQVKQAVPEELKDSAAILNDYFLYAQDAPVADLYHIEPPTMVQFGFQTPDPADKPAMVAFCKPFVPPAFVPINNKDSNDQAIKGRVQFPREQAETILGGFKMTQTKLNALNEFVCRLVPEPGRHSPMDHLEIAARQVKPGQKRDLNDAGFVEKFTGIVTSFMKKEAYGKPTDPRNITTFPAKVKIDYAAFMYPLMDYMKRYDFYAFGKTPFDVAQRVAQLCVGAQRVSCPDISRMDGFVNHFARTIERAVGLRFFAPEHAAEFTRTHEESFGNTGITSDGTRYEQGFSRGSGEMGTSVWNTIINLFMIFYAKYMEVSDFDAAWAFLQSSAIAGGDDSVVGDIPPAHLIRAAQHVGFILKCPTYTRGQVGVNFLARIYGPDVWEGCPDSMCSLRRQMEKIHLTPSVPLSPEEKLFEKASSFDLTDRNTPVIGNFCRAVLRTTVVKHRSGLLDRYGDHHPREHQYPNEFGDWMIDVAAEELPLLRLSELCEFFDGVQRSEELLHAPVFYEEGREFTYEEWDPTPGMLIAKTLETLKVNIIKPTGGSREKRHKPDSAQNVVRETVAAASNSAAAQGTGAPTVAAKGCKPKKSGPT